MAQRVSLGDWPRLTRFYGIGPSELGSLPANIIAVYAEALPVLQAEEVLLGFTTSDMPYASAADRRRIHRAWERYLPAPEPEKIDLQSDGGKAVAASLGIVLDFPQPEVQSEAEVAS